MTPAQHLAKARRVHDGGCHLLAGSFGEAAGREAYLAALHAALAYNLHRTGKTPKTHGGTRSEFSRLAREDPRVDPNHAILLGRAYEFKTVADYEQVMPFSQDDITRALQEALAMIDAMALTVETECSR